MIESSTAMPSSPAANALLGANDVGDQVSDHDDGAQDEDLEQLEDRAAKPRAGSLQEWLEEIIDDPNVARRLDSETLRKIGMDVCREFEIDVQSRADWEATTEAAMKSALQKTPPKSFPWPGAANVVFPLVLQATIDFASRTYPALIQGRKVVKGAVYGSDKGTPVMENGQPKMQPAQPGQPPQPVWLIAPGEKRARAERIATHMSWQLLEEMPEWEGQTDALLHQIPIVGGAARKTFYDTVEQRPMSLSVSLMNLVWNYSAPSFEMAQRHTEKLLYYPAQIEDLERAEMDDNSEGVFLALNYGPGDATGLSGEQFGFSRISGENQGDDADPDAPHLFIEQHRRLDLDGDGYAEPYVVTCHLRSTQVVRIVARFDKEGIKSKDKGEKILKITPVDYYTLIPFFPALDGSSHPSGWGHLLKSLGDQINTTLNQMFDAGTLSNAGGGFIGDQVSMPSGQALFQVGKFIRVTTKGASLRESIYQPNFQGPSAVLFQLLGFLVEAARGMAGLQNILAGDAAIANAPPTTILALIEQGLKTYTAIHKRIWLAFKREYEKLARINRVYLKEKTSFTVGDEEYEVDPNDYRIGTGVVPVADPSVVSDMQKLARAQILLQFKGDPAVNQTEIYTRFFTAADFDRVEDLLAPPNPAMAAAAQMEMAMKQGELGRVRAAELKDQTQAFLNLALARTKSTGPEEAFIAQQLDFLRLHIEALNTSVKAAAVDAKFHGSHMKATSDHARILASQGPVSGAPAAVQPTPGPVGPFPIAPGPPPGPQPGGVGPVAQPSDLSGLPPIPGGPTG